MAKGSDAVGESPTLTLPRDRSAQLSPTLYCSQEAGKGGEEGQAGQGEGRSFFAGLVLPGLGQR